MQKYYVVSDWSEDAGYPSSVNHNAFESLEEAKDAYRRAVAQLPKDYDNECRSNPSPHITMRDVVFWVELEWCYAESLDAARRGDWGCDPKTGFAVGDSLGQVNYSYSDHCGGRKWVVNYWNDPVDFEVAVNIMDDDVREELHAKFDGDVGKLYDLPYDYRGSQMEDQLFFDSYCAEHLERYDEEFEPNKKCPQI